MENNNDISLFEKIVFVDNIPSEDEAQRLSSKYPFAVFISDHNNTYNENITNIYEASNERDWNQFAFNNLWKGGKRLTKFNNIDFDKSSVNMDTFTIDLQFDMQKGLLSLIAKAKVDGYKILGLIQRKGLEDYAIYLDQMYIYNNLEHITNDNFEQSWNIDSLSFESITTDAIYKKNKVVIGTNENVATDGIDAIDNKFYIIVSFESNNPESLSSVPANAYSIYSINEEFTISAPPMFAEDKLKQIIEINNTEDKDNLIKKILKYTNDITYDDKYQRCIIYEVTVNKNVEPLETNFEDTSLASFGFESLKNIQQMDIEYLFAYVNPTGFELKANIENKWVTIDQDNIKENYFMPGNRTEFILTIFPENVRRLKLPISVTSRESGQTTNYRINTDYTSVTLYNFDSNNIHNSIPENSVSFSIYTPIDFTCDQSQMAFLNLQCRNYKDYPRSSVDNPGLLRYECNNIKLKQYIFKNLELSNPWTNSNIVKSGTNIDYSLETANALFYTDDDGDGIVKRWPITEEDDDFINLLIICQHKINSNVDNIDVNTIENPLILEDTTVSTPELNKYSQYILTHNIPLGSQKEILVPWISSTTESIDNGKRVSSDYIYGLYSYHGFEDKRFNKYIKPDTLKNIYLINNVGTSQSPDYRYAIQFTKSIYDGDEPLEIETGDYVETINEQTVPFIAFEYENGQIVNGYNWFFHNNLNELKNKLIIQYTINGTLYNVPAQDVSIVDGKIRIKSGEDVANDRYYSAYIKIDDYTSNIIEAMTEKLMIDWWIYIGKFTTTTVNGATKYNPSIAFPTTTVETGFKLKEISEVVMGSYTLQIAVHKGGWIHLGKVELRTTQFQRWNLTLNPPGWETITGTKLIWEAGDYWSIDTQTTEWAEDYIVLVPNELGVFDTFRENSNTVDNNYKITNNKGTYIVYKINDENYGLFPFHIKLR